MYLKDLIEFFLNMVKLIAFGVTGREILRVEISEKILSQQKIPKYCIFKGQHLANDSAEPNSL